jgi:hypothetical protein
MKNHCDAVRDNMTAYRNLYYYLEGTFDGCEVSHISRSSNEEADTLANIGSASTTRSFLGRNNRAVNQRNKIFGFQQAETTYNSRLGG